MVYLPSSCLSQDGRDRTKASRCYWTVLMAGSWSGSRRITSSGHSLRPKLDFILMRAWIILYSGNINFELIRIYVLDTGRLSLWTLRNHVHYWTNRPVQPKRLWKHTPSKLFSGLGTYYRFPVPKHVELATWMSFFLTSWLKWRNRFGLYGRYSVRIALWR